MPSTRRVHRGAVLLEALVALVLVAIAGVGMLTVLGQTVDSNRQLHDREEETRAASTALERVLVWDRPTMLANVGRTRVACCVLTIESRTAALFRVAVSDTITGAVLLETSAYLPEARRADTP